MNMLAFLNIIITSIGFASLIGGLIYIGRKLQTLDDLKSTIDKIKNNVKVISDYLVKHHEEFDPTELHAYSPLSLTEAGQALIREIGFDNVFSAHKPAFFDLIEADHPKLKYDVETSAIKSIHIVSQEPFMDFLKVFLYNNPKRSIENVAPTLGVYVRDMYLAEHPEITQ